MSKCLRCGAGNEWIEPVAKEAKKPRRRRPKVRYVARGYDIVKLADDLRNLWVVAESYSPTQAKRIAAALNLAEAVRRGEV